MSLTLADDSMDDNGRRVPEVKYPLCQSSREDRFRLIPAGTFAKGPLPVSIIKGVLPQAELAVFYGASTAGKSFILIDMMGAIARGHSWRGITVKQRRVVYIVAEGVKGFRARLRAYSQRHGIDLDTVPFVVVTEPPNLLQQDDKALAASVKAWGGADIIIFDTLAQSTPGANENTSEGIGKALAHCKRLHRVTGAMIVLVAHTGKDASKGVRGWSGIRGAADVQIEVVCHGDQRAIKIDKQKDGKDGNEFGFRLEEVVIGQNDDGDDVTSCVVEHLMTMPVAARKKEPQSRNQALILRIASELLRSGKGPVSERDLIEACVSQMPRKESAGCDNRRRDLARAFMGLVAANLIDTRAGHVELK